MLLLPLWLLLLLGANGELQQPDKYSNPGVVPHQKCVSGFCLPPTYEKLDLPVVDTFTTVHVETDIMDVLQVRIVHVYVQSYIYMQ